MSAARIVEELKHLSTADRLTVIAEATRLLRAELDADVLVERDEVGCSLRASAELLQQYYASDPEVAD